MNPHMLITVHSGGLEAPANSREYLLKACRIHPDIVEIDVRKSIDDIIVLWHDESIPGCNEPISCLPYAQLKVAAPQLLTLKEAMDICAESGICLNLDIKEAGAIPALCRMLQATPHTGETIFSGCGKEEIATLHQLLPGARVLLNATPWNPAAFSQYTDYALKQIRAVEALQCFGLNISYNDVRPELIGYAKLHDIPVFVWTVDDILVMRDMIKLGVYSITTNNVELLRREMNNLRTRGDRKSENVEWLRSKDQH
ncbi:MAG: glycerophosphodiester phosphodiesterase [Spirochaetota bacterium]